MGLGAPPVLVRPVADAVAADAPAPLFRQGHQGDDAHVRRGAHGVAHAQHQVPDAAARRRLPGRQLGVPVPPAPSVGCSTICAPSGSESAMPGRFSESPGLHDAHLYVAAQPAHLLREVLLEAADELVHEKGGLRRGVHGQGAADELRRDAGDGRPFRQQVRARGEREGVDPPHQERPHQQGGHAVERALLPLREPGPLPAGPGLADQRKEERVLCVFHRCRGCFIIRAALAGRRRTRDRSGRRRRPLGAVP